jgi:hypothetical protein
MPPPSDSLAASPAGDDDAAAAAALERARSALHARLAPPSSGLGGAAAAAAAAVNGARAWLEGLRADVAASGERMARDVAEGKARLAAAEAARARAAGAPAAAVAAAVAAPAAPAASAAAAAAAASGPWRHALVGFNASFPLLAFAAAHGVVELVRAEGASLTLDALTRGCARGAQRWLPLGLGAATFVAAEHALREPLRLALPPRRAGAHESAGAPSGAAALQQRQPQEEPPATWLTKSAAGALAGLAAGSLPFALRWPGFREPAALAALVSASALGAAAFCPTFEELDVIERGLLK